jgi:hypothetical protein
MPSLWDEGGMQRGWVMCIGGASLGGLVPRDVSIQTEQKPTRNSSSRPSNVQKFKSISNARDESVETGTQLLQQISVVATQKDSKFDVRTVFLDFSSSPVASTASGT